MTQTLLNIDSLEKSFGTHSVLKGVHLTLEPGQHVGLIGNNGQGKTTLIKLILGLIKPDSGSIELLGSKVGFPRSRAQKHHLGYLPESVNFYPKLTGLATLRFLARLKGADIKEVEPLLERVGLAEAVYAPVGTYSKGMRQRLGLAQALLGKPSILLLDEPSNGLDPQGTREFYAILEQLQEQNVAILTASHLLAEIETRLDRMVLLKNGRCEQEGTIHDLVTRAELPIHIHVQLGNPTKVVLKELEKLGAVVSPNGHPHGYHLTCAEVEKLKVLEILLRQRKHMESISVREPGLEEVVHHYQGMGPTGGEENK